MGYFISFSSRLTSQQITRVAACASRLLKIARMTGEERFEQWRRAIGLAAAPTIFALLWIIPLPGVNVAAQRLAAVLGAVVVLWITEAIPLPVTAMLGPALCVLLGIAPAK